MSQTLSSAVRKRGVIYASAASTNASRSIEYQIRECRKKMQANNVDEVHSPIVDIGSGNNYTRAGSAEILNIVNSESIDYLYLTGLDRIGRDFTHVLCFLQALRIHNVTIVLPKGEFDLNRLEDLIVNILTMIATAEQSKRQRNMVLRSKVGAFISGKWNLPVPLAYQKKGTWIIKTGSNWDAIIHHIFSLFLHFRSYMKVCEAINSSYEFSLKRPLKAYQIKQILVNPVYTGKPQLKGTIIEKNYPNTIVNDPSLAYIDETLFVNVQEILSAKD